MNSADAAGTAHAASRQLDDPSSGSPAGFVIGFATKGAFLQAALWSVVAGIAVFFATTLVTEPFPFVTLLGENYQAASAAPFEFLGKSPQRILGPLLAWTFGYGGEGYAQFAQHCVVLFLCVVFLFSRACGASLLDAWLITAAIGFSGACQIFKRIVGYPEPLTFAIMLSSLLLVRHAVWFWLLQACCLFNHELYIFFAPWMLFMRRQLAQSRISRDLLGLAAIIAAYGAFRIFVASTSETQAFGAAYYLERHFFPHGTLWLSFLAVVHSVVNFGPLLIVLSWQLFMGRGRGLVKRPGIHLALVLLGLCTAFNLAYDVFRFANFVFLPVLFASLQFLGTWRNRGIYAICIGGVIASWLAFEPDWLITVSTTMLECGAYHDGWKIWSCVVPRTAWMLAGFVGGFALYGAAGWLLARRTRV